MAGKGKGFVWQDYLTAYEIVWRNGCESLDSTPTDSNPEQPWRDDILVSHAPTPEDILIKKDLVARLSQEAQEIICIVLNSPAEIVDTFKSEKYDRIHKDRIKKFLMKEKHWKAKTIDKYFDELAEFSAQLQ